MPPQRLKQGPGASEIAPIEPGFMTGLKTAKFHGNLEANRCTTD
jgi:hypothetical protein